MKSHSIFRGLRSSILKQAVLPALLCTISLWILGFLPAQSFLYPSEAGALLDTGMDYLRNGKTAGHYYYSIDGGVCRFYLLKPQPETDEASRLPDSPVRMISTPPGDHYRELLARAAAALGWSAGRVENLAAPFLLKDASLWDSRLLALFSLAAFCALLSACSLLCSALCLLFPRLTRTLRRLSRYGNPKALLAQAEMELKHTGTEETAGIYLTPNFIISLGAHCCAVLPVKAVVRVCCRKPLGRRFHLPGRIFCVLCLETVKGHTYRFPITRREDSQRLMEAFQQTHPRLFAGYPREFPQKARSARR